MSRPPLDLKAAAREMRERARREQGLPPYIEDPVVLDQLADLLDPRRLTERESA